MPRRTPLVLATVLPVLAAASGACRSDRSTQAVPSQAASTPVTSARPADAPTDVASQPSPQPASQQALQQSAQQAPQPLPPPSARSGEVSLVIQRVVTRGMDIRGTGDVRPCGGQLLGFDVLVETAVDGGKADRRAVFCPPGKKDAFRMCRRFRRCTIDEDAGATGDRASVTCDGEPIVLEATGSATRVTAPNVLLEIAPAPLRVAPTKRVERGAIIDC